MTKGSRRSVFFKDRVLDLGVVQLGRKKLEEMIYWKTENSIGFSTNPHTLWGIGNSFRKATA